jgi:hypothetical protein
LGYVIGSTVNVSWKEVTGNLVLKKKKNLGERKRFFPDPRLVVLGLVGSLSLRLLLFHTHP